MIKKLVHWAVHNQLVVLLLAVALLAFGLYSYQRVNVEAYPDPAPPIVEVVAQYPGASAEDVERQVTIPLEVALAGMPGLTYTRTQSLFELSHLRNQFDYGVDGRQARQEVINRLHQVELPPGIVPEISPQSPTGEILRYMLRSPRDEQGRPIYSLSDLKSLQDYTLNRAFRRLPRIIDVVSFGGTVKRYEIRPDPSRLQRYGITLQQLKDAIASSNANVGGQYVSQGEAVQVVRGLGLIGQGGDPIDRALGLPDPIAARDFLRSEEERRIRELRQIVVASTNNVPIHVGDLVEGGALRSTDPPAARGVIVGHQTRLGRVLLSQPKHDPDGQEIRQPDGVRDWDDDDDIVQAVVLLRKGEESKPALKDVNDLIHELNTMPGGLLPGVQVVPLYDRSDLIEVTTHTVQENLLVGMALVATILLMFLSNVRSALIVAINVPLALLFAFGVLYLRGKSANLLSIGAVDFGIIVDSSVIIVENIYRHLSTGAHADEPLLVRVQHAADEIQRSLVFSTAIMVCAFLPLFTMSGPEGQIFGPMADTYAFALGGALLLAVALSPVLSILLLRHVRPSPGNFVVRTCQAGYAWQLKWCLRHPGFTLAGFAAIVAVTVAALPFLGREFMPELEEGNLWIQATFPLNSSLEETFRRVCVARDIMKKYPESERILAQIGRPDDGTDPCGFFNAEFFLPLKPHAHWPIPAGRDRPRTKEELVEELNDELERTVLGAGWNFSQNIRNMVMESLSGVRGENSVKIIGPDLHELERLAGEMLKVLSSVDGIKDPGMFRILGQSNLAFPIDRERCARWGVTVGDVQDVIATAVGGKPVSQMIEGERTFDITLRWPESLRGDQDAILNIPVEVGRNVVASGVPGLGATMVTGAATGPAPVGNSAALPATTGSSSNATINDLTKTPRRHLKDLLIPQGDDGQPDPHGSFIRPGASDIYREKGKRLIALKFDVRGRDLASAVAEAQRRTAEAKLIQPPYRLAWSGEFLEMEEAEKRLAVIIPLAVGMVFALLFMAFRSFVDVLLVLSNVVALCCGGVWALLLTQTNFSISAAVGFISIFGVAVMNGLLLVSFFHRLRLEGLPLEQAILEGSINRLRPMMMTSLTAIFGLLPAALSTRIGAQSQRPLAIVVIGGMLMALLLNQYLTPVLYKLLRRSPPNEEAARWAE